MTDLLKIKFPKGQALSSLLGLSLDGSRLDGVVLHRTANSLQEQQAFSVTLSLDPLTNDPVLVGREIRNQLEAAGIKERRCIFGLPLKWALVVHTKVPADLSDEDIASFLEVEAERGFPCDVSTLQMASSTYTTPSGEMQATMIGIPLNHITVLEQVLKAAQLKPVSFSLGITALQPADAENSEGVLAFVIGESGVGLQISSGGGIVALRALEGNESGQQLNADSVSREARITLGQCESRESVRRIRIFGPRELAKELAEEMQGRFQPMGLKVEVATKYDRAQFGLQLPLDMPVSLAASLAAQRLAGVKTDFEFLPPKITPFQKYLDRYSSGTTQKVALVVITLLLVGGGLFGYQTYQLTRLESEWDQLAPKYKGLDDIHKRIAKYNPWYDDSMRTLSIMKQLTMAFPQVGSVSAKAVEIREQTVSCNGIFTENPELLRTIERLRAAPTIADFKMGSIRGSRSPMQFSFEFRWVGGKEK
jgi:hypothetical protein